MAFRALVEERRVLPFAVEASAVPEWLAVQEAVQSHLTSTSAWQTLTSCPHVEVYTDGSAPIRNPGGPAGCAAIALGYKVPVDVTDFRQPSPHVRLDIGVYIAARRNEPQTSSVRAELAGVLLALELLRRITLDGAAPKQVTIRCDNRMVVNCGTGTWKRKSNLDLWSIYNYLVEDVSSRLAAPFDLTWIKGHAGAQHNEAADDLATCAAFDFDDTRYKRYRTAQALTGREMPGNAAMGVVGSRPAPTSTSTRVQSTTIEPDPGPWLCGTDYTLVQYTHIDGGGQPNVGIGPAIGRYQIWIKSGRGRRGEVSHTGERIHDEAEYLTLIAALTDLLGRIAERNHDPSSYTLTVYSRRELVAKQLTGEYKVHSAALRPVYAQARDLLGRFERVDTIWHRGPAIKQLLGR